MDYFFGSFLAAVRLIFEFDPEVYRIAWTSIRISFSSALLAAFIAVPLGGWVALHDFPGKRFLEAVMNALMALPTVTIGLIFYGLLSRNGPLGEYGLLYSPAAIILGECVLIFPIMVNLSVAAVHSADGRLLSTLKMLGANRIQQLIGVVREMRKAIFSGLIAGFGRAIGEVGVAMMLGGNIQGFTRTMTTAIALETNKGEFEFALALGLLLLLLAFSLSGILQKLKEAPLDGSL